MLKKYFFVLGFLSVFLSAQAPENYYSGTENLSGYALKTKLHEIISKNNFNWHYNVDVIPIFGKTDVDNYYEKDGTILDIYSENPNGPDPYNYTLSDNTSSTGSEGLGWQREHLVPQSTYNSNYPMYSDLFYLMPVDARINNLRRNYPHGYVGSTIYYPFLNGSKQGNSGIANATYTGRVYEPIDEFKGDIARALLYFVTRYEDKLYLFNYQADNDPKKDESPLDGTLERAYEPWYIEMLLDWHKKDPVSIKEIDRNNTIYELQKNRNPFIDHPEWVELIWNQTLSSVTPSAPNLSVDKVSAYFVNLRWETNSESNILGYKVYQDNNLVSITKTNYISIDHLEPNKTHKFYIKAYNNAYLESLESNAISVTTLDSDDIFAKDLQIIKYIEGNENNKALEIVNRTGHDVNLSKYKIYAEVPNNREPFFLEGILKEGKSIVIINHKSNLNCYDKNLADFAASSPAMTFSGSQYVELSYDSKTVDVIGVKSQTNNNGNKSLYRKSNILNPSTSFNINEWEEYGADYCEGLGANLSVSDFTDNSKTFIVYPNPVSDKLSFSSDKLKSKTAEILDLSGKVLKTVPIINNSVNVSNLKPNVYLIKIGDKTAKFIKK